MKSILSVFGTRPEAIKMAPLLRELEGRRGLRSRVCVTAQHREMLDQVLRVFDIRPDYDLDLMRPGQSLSAMTSAALRGLDRVLAAEKPDLLLVHGDTASCLCGALAAWYRRIPIGHVEAGLRSGDKFSPYPEEMNRMLTDRMSDLLFAPTERSRENLLRENMPAEAVFVTGNTVVDALSLTAELAAQRPEPLPLPADRRLLLLTVHRRESIGDAHRRIFRAVRTLCAAFPDLTVVCPLHPNPAVREASREIPADCGGVILTEPLDVVDFHRLLTRAALILTDSGGIQEEAAALGKPVLVLRDRTERGEGLESGTLKLIGTETDTVVREASRLLRDPEEYARRSRVCSAFGDGHAGRRIADAVENYLERR